MWHGPPLLNLDDDGTPTGAAAVRRCAAQGAASCMPAVRPASRKAMRGPWHRVTAVPAGRACRTSRQRTTGHASAIHLERAYPAAGFSILRWCGDAARKGFAVHVACGRTRRVACRNKGGVALAPMVPRKRAEEGTSCAGSPVCAAVRRPMRIPVFQGRMRYAPGLQPARFPLPRGLACRPRDGTRHLEGMMAHAACRTAADLHPIPCHRPGAATSPPLCPPSC
jgi:hypothetical protein